MYVNTHYKNQIYIKFGKSTTLYINTLTLNFFRNFYSTLSIDFFLP